MIVISTSLVLSPSDDINGNNPAIGSHNVVTIDNIVASSENVLYPATNLANAITAPGARWQANDDGDQTITISIADTPVDYIGIARHNLGSNQRPVKVEGSMDGGSTWSELVQEILLPNDAPAMFRFELQSPSDVRFVIGESNFSGGDPAEIATLYLGQLLIMQRRLYVGHVPITMGVTTRIANGRSEGGDFLGRIVLSEENSTTADFSNLTPSWVRTYLEPFLVRSREEPFFFAWRPEDYPLEVGFVQMTNDPRPVNQRNNGMMQTSFEMSGVT